MFNCVGWCWFGRYLIGWLAGGVGGSDSVAGEWCKALRE